MHIDPWTIALQAVNFLVLVWLLQRFFYRPVRAVIEKRRQLAAKAFADAAVKEKDAEAAKQRFDDERARLDQERRDMRKAVHEDMARERNRMIEETRAEAARLIEEARAAIAAERAGAADELRDQAADVAATLAATLLRNAGVDPAEAALARIETRLKDLAGDDRARLERELAGPDTGVTVVTAAPLASTDQARWETRLAAALGATPGFRFESDNALLGGAELRFPHTVMRFTWADQIAQARNLLRQADAAS